MLTSVLTPPSSEMKLRSGIKIGQGDGMKEDSKASQLNSDSTITILGRSFNYVLFLTHFNIFLYASCFFIQVGTLPYLSKELGVNVTMFGYLQTVFAVVQLCGGPLFGRFGDLFGGRAALTLAFASAALSYGLMGIAFNFSFLLLSRIPSIFMHAMQGGQMLVTDITEKEKRADALGKLGVSYGVGMVVGPLVGGIVNKHLGANEAALVASAGSLCSMFMVFFLLPRVTKKSNAEEDNEPAGNSSVFDLKKILSLLRGNPRAVVLLTVKTVTGIPLGLWQAIMGVITMEVFHLEPHHNGYLTSFAGILVMAIQGIGIGILTKRFTDYTLIKWASFILIWSWLLTAFVANVWQLCLAMIPKCLGLVILNVIVSSTLTKTVSDADTGTMLGISMAVNSLIRAVSPTLGGLMLQNLGFSSFGYFGFITSIGVTLYLFRKGSN